jgi:hypothetical protein
MGAQQPLSQLQIELFCELFAATMFTKSMLKIHVIPVSFLNRIKNITCFKAYFSCFPALDGLYIKLKTSYLTEVYFQKLHLSPLGNISITHDH